jgi:hypothetical protein
MQAIPDVRETLAIGDCLCCYIYNVRYNRSQRFFTARAPD